ncbi:LAME_0H03092g1_1 [Lachancea meyersii CBS 8951]|uniref:LAME_0H03092g1_1 n=1 Tax=Lachancea meyersii CBS 8951 TaxID=1266667 RepID=A0A1G4KDP0_9SACH|nr:LAME_0H03092g1_1 [Lachancea meyersii CBS 8951]
MDSLPKSGPPLAPTLDVENGVRKLRLVPCNPTDGWENAMRFVNAVRAVKPDHEIEVAKFADSDPLTALVELLAADQDHREVGADLLAVVFAYCVAHRDLAPVARRFARGATENHTLGSQLRKICGTVTMSPDYRPGVYSVLAKLDFFEKLSTEVLQAVKLGLGAVLRTVWIPLWTFQTSKSDLYSCVVTQNLLLAATEEHKLDFLIASRAYDLSQWNELKDRDVEPLNFFVYKVARRVVYCRSHVFGPFREFCQKFISRSIGDDCFQKLDKNVAFNLSVFMEIVDHPELNFLDEPHLTFFLNSALRRTRDLCEHNEIQTLHMELGSMGSTQSLIGLTNILQYILARFLVNAGSLMVSAGHFNFDKNNWALRSSPYELPLFFNQVIPNIPPTSRAAFSFDKNRSWTQLQASKSADIVACLFDSLNHLISINYKLLEFFEIKDIDLSLDFRVKEQKTTYNEPLVVENKSKLQFLELCFISNTSAMLLSDQLQDEAYFITMVDEQEAKIQSRIIASNVLSCFESLTANFTGALLYQFIKFTSRVSLMELKLHKVSMQILYHIFFGSRSIKLQDSSLTSKLTQQALYDLTAMWNDGSDTYTRFLTDIFNTSESAATTVRIEISEFSKTLFPHNGTQAEQLDTGLQHNSNTEKAEFKKSILSSKYNANASSFVPSNKSYGDNIVPLTIRAHSSSRSSEHSKVLATPVEGLSLRSPFSTGKHQHFSDSKDFTAPMSGPAPSSLGNISPWSPSCFSQGLPLSPDTGSAVSTGKNYILGGHNRAANNSRAQSVHVDRFNYMRQ